MALLYLYHVKDHALHRLYSSNWGVTFGSDETVIPTTENLEKTFVFLHEGREYCYGVDTSGNLYCYMSNTHFDDGTYTLGTNKFLIVEGADTDINPSGYTAHGKFYCYTMIDDAQKGYISADFGRTWAAI